MIAETQNRFRLPEIAESAKLIADFENSSASKAVACFHEQKSYFRRAIEAMRAPWLDIENKILSIGGFVELQSMGLALRTLLAFGTTLADRLRADLGDWRAKINWPDAIFTDPLARTEFYTARGLDPNLTAFPASAFEESVMVAGIKRTLPSEAEA